METYKQFSLGHWAAAERGGCPLPLAAVSPVWHWRTWKQGAGFAACGAAATEASPRATGGAIQRPQEHEEPE
jgi:hypothetical protein